MNTANPWPDFKPTDDPLDQLVRLSRYYGADPEFVKAGGGNTSFKVNGRMWVKASGGHLGEIGPEDFVELDLPALAAVLTTDFGQDQPACEEAFFTAVNAARVDPESRLIPSLETTLHSQIPNRFVVHSHSTTINCLTCCVRGEALTAELFGDAVAWMPYVDPGIGRTQAMRRALADYTRHTGHAFPRAIMMQNHGPVIGGDTPEEVRETTDWIVEKITSLLNAVKDDAPFGPVRRLDPIRALALGAEIRNWLSELLRREKLPSHLLFDGSAGVLSLAGGQHGRAIANLGPLTPQQLAYCHSSFPLWIGLGTDAGGDATPITAATLGKAISAHIADTGLPPRVFLIEGLGLFAAGEDAADAEVIRSLYVDAIEIMAGALRLGGIRAFTAADRDFMETWLINRA